MSETVPERLEQREDIFTGRVLGLSRDHVRLPDGSVATREVVHHSGAVAVVALDHDDRALLVRQWRHAVGRPVWELCAGTLEPHEDPPETARRELAEETGFRAARWAALGAGPTSPGYSTEILHFFAARELTPGTPSPDEGEDIEARFFARNEVIALISQETTDLKTMAGLALAGWLSGGAR